MIGTVQETLGGIYRVRLDSGQVMEASLRGRLKKQTGTGGKVVIGDKVEMREDAEGAFTVEAVMARTSEFLRRGPGGRRPKLMAANLDRLVVVMALAQPRPNLRLLDRLLVIGESCGIGPVIVLNKTDLVLGREAAEDGRAAEDGGLLGGRGAAEGGKAAEDGRAPGGGGTPRDRETPEGPVATETVDVAARYREIGYPVLETSAKTGMGLEELRGILSKGFSALVGPSGVGKSSLLNALEPGLRLRIGSLSRRRGKGKHTTVNARLIPLSSGGFVADTPGFSDAGTWGVDARELEACFPEFAPYGDQCRFRACTHLHEPGCEVREALVRGEILEDRFESYRSLVGESEGS